MKTSGVFLDSYTTIIMDGRYDLDATDLDKLRDWVSQGGTLIGIESGCTFLSNNGFAKLSAVEKAPASHEPLPELRPYGKRSEDISGRTKPGTIFQAELDTTHPLAYGYQSQKLAVFTGGRKTMAKWA